MSMLPEKPLSEEFRDLETRGFIPLAHGVDVSKIRSELDAHPELWDSIKFRRLAPDSPHTKMSDIWVRSNKLEKVGHGFCDEHLSVWYPAAKLLPSVKDFVMDTMAFVRGEVLGGVLITRIPPGGSIAKHADTNWHARYYDKFYLQISGAPEQTFSSDDAVFAPVIGDVYWFNNQREHWVENNSNVDRITLIVCIRIDRD